MSLKKDMKELRTEAEAQGWRIELLKSGHYRAYAPDGEHIVHMPGTPSDRRSLDNTAALMRQFGFVWKGH